MSKTPLSQDDVALILGELDEVAPDAPFARSPDFAAREVAAREVKPFAFGNDSFRPVERLAGLERMGEKLARALKPAIEPFARARLQVSAAPITITPFDDWQDTLPPFLSLSHYRLRPLKGGMLLTIEADLIAGLVESFYGGTGLPRPHRGGDFTASEELLLARLLERVVGIVLDQWREVIPIEATLAQRETNAAHISFVRGDEPVAVQRFVIEQGARRSTIAILYPLAMLRPIEERMATKVHDEDAQTSGDWRRRLEQAMGGVSLPVRSILARPEISVAQLLALKVGDVIPITLAQRTPLQAGTLRIAEGTIGEQDGRAALMIEKVGTI